MKKLCVLLLFALPACGGVYRLRPPPPETERASIELNPVDEQAASDARYMEARRVLVDLYSKLAAQQWDEAVERLTLETRVLLSESGHGDATETLAAGEVRVRGTAYRFDPVELLLLPNPTGFEDSVIDEVESETPLRKEVFIRSGEEVRRVVLILQDGAWRLHLRRLPLELLERTAT